MANRLLSSRVESHQVVPNLAPRDDPTMILKLSSLRRCDFPAPAIPETSTTRSRDARMCSSALLCSSVSFAGFDSKAGPIGLQVSHPPRTRSRSCSSSSFACSVVTCESSSCMNRSLLTYRSTSSRDNLPQARFRISAVSDWAVLESQ